MSWELDPSLFHQPLNIISTDFLHSGDDDAYLFIPSDTSSSDSLEDVFAKFIQQQLHVLRQLREHVTTRTDDEILACRLCLARGSQYMQGLLHRFANHHKQPLKPVFSKHRQPPTTASGSSAVSSGFQAGQNGPIHKSGHHRPKAWNQNRNQKSQRRRLSSLCPIPRHNDSNHSPRLNLHALSVLRPTSPVHGINLAHPQYPGVPVRGSGQLKAQRYCGPLFSLSPIGPPSDNLCSVTRGFLSRCWAVGDPVKLHQYGVRYSGIPQSHPLGLVRCHGIQQSSSSLSRLWRMLAKIL